jgi:outer membrane protein assembly factor BamA
MLELLLAMSLVHLVDTTHATSVVSGFSRTEQAQSQPQEAIIDIRVQGNVLTTDAEMRQLAGVDVGTPFTPDLPDVVTERLRKTRKFESIQVLKRFASIADPSQIILVIIVNEGPVKLEIFKGVPDGPPTAGQEIGRVVKRRGLGLMWLPLLDFEDGYGFTYGVQLARQKVLGQNSRLSFPLTWGGDKQAGAQLEKIFNSGPLTRVETGAALDQRTNPFFLEDDTRDRLWVRGERAIGQPLRIGAFAGWQHVSFMNNADRFTQAGADVTFDTRLDPFLARNAVYGRAAIEHLDFAHAQAATRTEIDGRAYVGLYGQNILILRVLRQDSDVPLPPYLEPMLGGMSNLRGFRAGSFIGDTLVSGTAEIRAPLTSPLKIAKAGVSAFVDVGTVYDKGQRLADQHFSQGVGGGVWLTAAFLRFNLVVAHGIGAGTRVHFGAGVSF